MDAKEVIANADARFCNAMLRRFGLDAERAGKVLRVWKRMQMIRLKSKQWVVQDDSYMSEAMVAEALEFKSIA